MKAITLLVALTLAAFAMATATTNTETISATYAWWFNLGTTGVAMGIYLTCLSTGWVSAFFANDGGAAFYECLIENGTSKTWGAMEAT